LTTPPPLGHRGSKFAYVPNNGDGTVSVITTATNEVSATIPVGNDPIGTVFTPDGKHGYFRGRSVGAFCARASARYLQIWVGVRFAMPRRT
jgi:YVTN family beta-propeller protein